MCGSSSACEPPGDRRKTVNFLRKLTQLRWGHRRVSSPCERADHSLRRDTGELPRSLAFRGRERVREAPPARAQSVRSIGAGGWGWESTPKSVTSRSRSRRVVPRLGEPFPREVQRRVLLRGERLRRREQQAAECDARAKVKTAACMPLGGDHSRGPC